MSEDRLMEAIKNLFNINLGIKKHERVLIFTDRVRKDEVMTVQDRKRRERTKDLARLVAEVCRGYCKEVLYTEYNSLMAHGSEPPEVLWRKAFGDKVVRSLKDRKIMRSIINKRTGEAWIKEAEKIISKNTGEAVDVVIGLSNYSTSHTRFRDLLTGIAGTRYASMPLFDPDMLFGLMDIDWRTLEKRTRDLAKKVNRTVTIKISTPNGTQISMNTEGRKAGADTGILTRRGSFGNLPAGEVYLAPLEGISEGSLVVEWAPTHELEYPVTLIVKEGKVIDIKGEDSYADVLRKKLSENDDFRNIAELGIGTNDRATRPDNILESEKILGTVHIALGDNSSFGGKVRTPFHQDFVFFSPTVRLIYRDGKEEAILKRGMFV